MSSGLAGDFWMSGEKVWPSVTRFECLITGAGAPVAPSMASPEVLTTERGDVKSKPPDKDRFFRRYFGCELLRSSI